MTEHDEASRAAGTPPTPHGSGQGEELTRRERRALRDRRRRPILRGIVIGLVVVLALVLGFGAYAAFRLNGNLRSLNIQSDLLRPDSHATTDPTSGHTAMNILLLGVDSRSGANSKYGDPRDEPGLRSDTTMLVHLAADRRSAVVVSIPRDAMIPAPPRHGQTVPATADAVLPTARPSTASGEPTPPGCDINAPTSQWKKRMFNSNIEDGGVECVVATVVHNTGLTVDHVMQVDFTGFKQIVNAMGTVRICTTKPVKDKDSGLDLSAGYHDLDGEQALAFVRTRHGVGDGSDIGRMRLQQDFAAAVVRKATSTGVLLNPPKLYGVLDAATKSLTTDPDLANVSALSGLAAELRQMKPSDVRFITAPTEPYAKDPNRLQLSPAATQLWTILREDRPWPGAGATASPTPTATVAPSSVPVLVENASTTNGLATQVANALKVQGFAVTGTSSAPAPVDGAVIHHAADQADAAKELALAIPGATLKADGKAGQPLRLSVGRGTPAVVAVPNREGSQPLPSQTITAAPAPSSSGSSSSSPSLTAKPASDDVCSDTSKQ